MFSGHLMGHMFSKKIYGGHTSWVLGSQTKIPGPLNIWNIDLRIDTMDPVPNTQCMVSFTFIYGEFLMVN